jgi:hypothetical protein
MEDFVSSLIDGTRNASEIENARKVLASAKPAKAKVRYFPRNERASEVATLIGIEVTEDDVFGVYRTAYHLGM